MAVNETIREQCEQMGAALQGPMTSIPIETLRGAITQMIPPSDVSVDHTVDVSVPSDHGPIPARLYFPNPTGDSAGVVLWQHGGGFAFGDIALGDDLARRICAGAGVVVVNLDYRLAPEHPFPAAFEDSLAAYQWIRSAPGELLEADTTSVAVAGESAGGNLALALAVYCRDHDLPAPACQVCVYGNASFELSNPEFGDLPLLMNEDVEWFWNTYAPNEADRTDPRAAPVHAARHDNLCPLLIISAAHDPVRDALEAYGHLLEQAGNEVLIRRTEGVCHGFLGFASFLPEAVTEIGAMCDFLRGRLRPD